MADKANSSSNHSQILDSITKPEREQVYYSDYIHLEKLLTAQEPLSLKVGGKLKHDEHLFIVIHQAYELWFKQILHELESVIEIFAKEFVSPEELFTCVSRLERIIQIFKVLVDQINILETMQPFEFLEFREYLFPASGFQSWQFRLLENKLGIDPNRTYKNEPYYIHFKPEHQKIVTESEKQPNLLQGLNKWLERTPFLKFEGFDFWQKYKEAVGAFLHIDLDFVKQNPFLSEQQKQGAMDEREKALASFDTITNKDAHDALVAQGRRKLSHQATLSALLIFLYKSSPALQLPYRFLTYLIDLDELLNMWRHRHMTMAHRMLGNKMGTGGSSGVSYLNKTVVSPTYRCFTDLFNLSTYLLPESALPEMPASLKEQLQFVYSTRTTTQG